MGNYTADFFEAGGAFDAVIMDRQHPLIACSSMDKVLSTFIYSGDATSVLGTITSGEWRVKGNRHLESHTLTSDFKAAISAIGIRK